VSGKTKTRQAAETPEKRRGRNPYYSGPTSDHFDGEFFYNPDGIPPGRLTDLLKWRFGKGRSKWPSRWPSRFGQAVPDRRVEGDNLVVTMVGHATMLVQTAGLNFLTDPVWSDRVSPLTFAGPKRVNAPGIAFDDLPDIDVVLLSHNHYDHLDAATLTRLVTRHDPLIVTPLGNDRIVRRHAPQARIHVGDWGHHLHLRDEIRIHFTPVHHWSARGMRDRRMALWSGFVIETEAGPIYHVGDTGFHDGRNFAAAGSDHGPFRLAILPIGAYEPRWFMKGQHINPEEAVLGMKLARAQHAVGHHWGTFQLTDEAIDAPLLALADAMERHEIDDDRFVPLLPGQSIAIPPLLP
jgi:L-ascorbate metabolism protein UlaG (beta-lactamase superfamily)